MQNALEFYHHSLPAIKIFFDTVNEPVSYHLYECLGDARLRRQPTYIWGSRESGILALFKELSRYLGAQGLGVDYYTPSTPIDPTVADAPIFGGLPKVLIVQDIDLYGEVQLAHILRQLIDPPAPLWYWVLVSASRSSYQLAMREDLRSRISAGFIHHMQDLAWSEKQLVIQSYIKYLGLNIRAETLDYIYHNYPRGLWQLLEVIDKIDTYTKASSYKITPTLVQQILGDPLPDL
ncbi:MAG: hypothetical protein QM520_04505 [Gammaproteobacteria bacterium]|nr:hypothetical protein [Gammaproteobacteria bacterium]